jgi:hypothetical protein
MPNPGVANSAVTNLLPVQAQYDANGNCIGLIGQGGTTLVTPLTSTNITANTVTINASATMQNSLNVNGNTFIGGALVFSNTPVTIASGFGTSPTITSNNTVGFSVKVGTAPGSTGTLTFPASPNGWIVTGWNITSASTLYIQQSAYSTTSATITSLANSSGSASPFNANDVLILTATPF